mmetsp:Transcript_33495/g.83483  ORF Transcript_33495/g.83483 Transcript_33495/m.83483 type:complete len:171 (+) Transcript_33495:352-864(+)
MMHSAAQGVVMTASAAATEAGDWLGATARYWLGLDEQITVEPLKIAGEPITAKEPHVRVGITLAAAADSVRVCGRSRHEWVLQWADEFQSDGLPDKTRWSFQTNCNAWVHSASHNEKQWYTANREENARVDGGVLRIHAQKEDFEGCEHTSARLHAQNKLEFTYGLRPPA